MTTSALNGFVHETIKHVVLLPGNDVMAICEDGNEVSIEIHFDATQRGKGRIYQKFKIPRSAAFEMAQALSFALRQG